MGEGVGVEGRRVVVTGGSRGIGAAVVRSLGARGARVLAVARGEEALHGVAREVGAQSFATDVATGDGVDALRRRVQELWGGPPDAVVHCAGAFALAPAVETSVELFDRALDVNLRAAFLLARAWLDGMIQRGAGQLIFIGSVAGRVALPGNAAYSASKFGLRGLHAVLATELRGSGVRVTLIEPAATDTPLWQDVDRDRFDALPEADAMLRPEDVAEAVRFALTRPAGVTIPNLAIERG